MLYRDNPLQGLEVTEEAAGDDSLYSEWQTTVMEMEDESSETLVLQPLPPPVPDAWARPSARVKHSPRPRGATARILAALGLRDRED